MGGDLYHDSAKDVEQGAMQGPAKGVLQGAMQGPAEGVLQGSTKGPAEGRYAKRPCEAPS